MATDVSEKPGLDERYIGATNSSNLTLNPDANCDATQLIAAGLLGNRMGAALIHLRGEWDAAGKPRKLTEAEIAAHAATLPKRQGKTDLRRARVEALIGYASAMRSRAHQMVGWLPAMALMREWAELRGVDLDLLSPALYHHLNPTCPVCDGLGELKVPGTPSLSGKQCYHCKGAKTWPRPLGAHRVNDWLKSCVGKAKGDRGGLLRGETTVQEAAEERQRREERRLERITK